ncbi:hypothetical protein [Candidatus Poriferisodalis multihospitum]|uniref:hypothetical protein n=1 Tax=Candidatus Poriferisodalis multihospitum TaxID=2983191 RepID=UPI0023941EFB|nr:hypothetical protein [Candidatus Poriferisodalis multihospitum]MDE0135778.1 hypothetical protein [Acidimicrobiaceae bacterium]
MTDSDEINEPVKARRDRPLRKRWFALLVTALLAATAVVAFSAGSASAQTQNHGSDAGQQQADADETDDTDDSDGTCDRDGARRGVKLGRFGMGDTLTELLGIDAETLREKLKGGSTLADIAAEQGVDVTDVVNALVRAISEKAAEHDREIDTDELSTRITAVVNGERPERSEGSDSWHGRRGDKHHGGMGHGRLGRWGGHGHENPASDASTSAAGTAAA